jgi:uncharacterized protein (TIGR03067 family)
LAAADGPENKSLNDLQGTWQLQSVTFRGQEAPADMVSKSRMVIAGNQLTSHDGDRVQPASTITVDATRKPGTIDSKLGTGQTIRGIYRLEEGTLTICVGPSGAERPKEFAAKAGMATRLLVLKPVKK